MVLLRSSSRTCVASADTPEQNERVKNVYGPVWHPLTAWGPELLPAVLSLMLLLCGQPCPHPHYNWQEAEAVVGVS